MTVSLSLNPFAVLSAFETIQQWLSKATSPVFQRSLRQPDACVPDTSGKLSPMQHINEDHAVVHGTAAAPLLAASGLDWSHIAAELPGFTPQMLNVADLLFKTEHEVVNLLNSIMKLSGLAGVHHVSVSINQVHNKYMRVAERESLEAALDAFFIGIAGDHAQACRQQWPTCVKWMRMRAAIAHPSRCMNTSTRTQQLRQIYYLIQCEKEYEPVREAAMAMTVCLTRMWNTSL